MKKTNKTGIIILIIITAIYPLFINLLSGTALFYNAYENYELMLVEKSGFVYYRNLGIIMMLSSVMLVLSTILCITKKNILSLLIETIGIVMCMAVVISLRKIAMESGMSDESFKPYKDIFTLRHTPTLIHTIVLYILALKNHFSQN